MLSIHTYAKQRAGDRRSNRNENEMKTKCNGSNKTVIIVVYEIKVNPEAKCKKCVAILSTAIENENLQRAITVWRMWH